MKAINTKRPSKLDLNAPLLSARRSNLAAMSSIKITRSGSLNGSCHRVPFLWEQSPGKPKESQTRDNVLEDMALPLPKPPPFHSREEFPTLAFHDDHGFNGNADDDEKEEDEGDESFSDEIDLFSLAKSLKTSSERGEEDDESDIHDNKKYNESMSPSFMIERFLPAATALAASSLSALAGDKQVNAPVDVSSKEGSCVPRKAGEAYSSSKGCGLEMLFPWRVKPRVCGVKNPVRQPRYRMKP